MPNFKLNLLATLIAAAIFSSCSNNSSSENSTGSSSSESVSEKDPYEIMHMAFVDYPEISTIKPMLEAVLDKYNFPKTNDNRLKVGNMLVVLRQASIVGVTEMEILKHIYQHGSNQISLPEQAGLSATILETSK